MTASEPESSAGALAWRAGSARRSAGCGAHGALGNSLFGEYASARLVGHPVAECDKTVSESTARSFFFFQAEDGIRDSSVTGVQTCALPILTRPFAPGGADPAYRER